MSKEKPSFIKWIQTGKVNKKLCIFVFMLFPLLLLVVFTYVPFLKMFQFSFYEMKYIGAREFVGLDNYAEVFSREDCFQALKLSGYYIVASFVQLAVALWFASLLSFKTHGGDFSRDLCSSHIWYAVLRLVLFLNSSIQEDSYWILYSSGAGLTWNLCLTG